jgi:hypothetical protein
MDKVGKGRFLRTKRWSAFAYVEVVVHEGDCKEVSVDFVCKGQGWIRQGRIEEVSDAGYEDWKRGAAAGVRFAFRLAGFPSRRVTVTKVEGTTTDTSPASVGAAAAIAVFNALEIPPPPSFEHQVEEIVFGARTADAPFSL